MANLQNEDGEDIRPKKNKAVWVRRILRQKSGLLGAFLVLLFLTAAAFPGVFSTHDPLEMNKNHRLEPPSARFWFGTDEFGRDIFSRVVFGSRVSLQISFFTVVLANIGGIILGVWGGYFGGLRDNIIMRLMDIMFSFPFILLAILIIAITGPGVFNVIISLAVAYLPYSARIARGAVMTVRENQYVEAAKASGAGNFRIIIKYIMPNITAPIVVYVTMSFAFALLAEAGLQFLGLGARPPTPAWGLMLNETRGTIEFAPWTGVFPGLAIALAVIGFNLFGDGLRDLLDPKMKS